MSKRDEDYNYVVANLTEGLQRHNRASGSSKRMTYSTLPLSTDAKFDDVNLGDIVTPPVPSDGILTEQLLDAWVYPLVDGESTPEKSLGEIGSKMLLEFVTRGSTFAEQTVRLLFALGKAEGATVKYDRSSIIVNHDGREYGMAHGVVNSRFCTGVEVGNVDIVAALDLPLRVRTYDQAFCSLYREAYRKGNYTLNALVAIAMRDATFSWQRMAKLSALKRYPSYDKLQSWERLLNTSLDPLGALYVKLVPKWMSSSEFTNTFGPVMKRSMAVRKDTINKWVNQMYTYFHKNNNQDQ